MRFTVSCTFRGELYKDHTNRIQSLCSTKNHKYYCYQVFLMNLKGLGKIHGLIDADDETIDIRSTYVYQPDLEIDITPGGQIPRPKSVHARYDVGVGFPSTFSTLIGLSTLC